MSSVTTPQKTNLAPYLTKLIVHPPQLTPADLATVLGHILSNSVSTTQVAAFLALLRGSGLDHSPDFIAAAVARMMQAARKLDTLEQDLKDHGFVDIVGTGGDGQNTFNVSTTASIVAAGAGLRVCKHGGKASTSASGAGDLLASLGINLANVTNETAPGILAQSQYCFLFAPVFHPAMATIAPVRKELGVPSIFNILGPLINPAPLCARIVGVYAESLGEVFARAIRATNQQAGRPESRAMVVWGTEGLDEISPAGTTKVWTVNSDPTVSEEDAIVTSYLHPNDFGLPVHTLDTVRSGTPQENAAVVDLLVDNKLEENHPVLDYVLMNVAALAYVEGTAQDLKHGVELARESIKSGRAREALDKFASLSQGL
ncbi:uncharacterized protein SAPINGB_P004479 [Magnusiomyces paraingens]|uniref:Anthranilate phosphoribosyltransferase n=1 Tax=Magnusiomyces paraingens TaxID=2606893 RepID=A0A5E8BWX5_9ASCO|nr:uncharacterized protein SAPINGB_P004479 [Saprochaete ingens]VVT55204.1 unnamed protein product [Saprochaete ingens]